MITPEQRRKLESEWSSDNQSIASIARHAKAAVGVLLVVVLAWIGPGSDRLSDAQDASTAAPALSSRQANEASALQASREVFEARRALWDAKPIPAPTNMAGRQN